MKRKKILSLLAPLVCAATLATGCSWNQVTVTSIEKTASYATEDIYTVSYSDGTSTDFTVRHGQDVTVQDIFDRYREEYGDTLTYAEFLDKYLKIDVAPTESVVGEALLSSFSVTAANNRTVQTGSAVLYAVNEDKNDAYLITNYHVTYMTNSYNGAVASRITCSPFGSAQASFTCTYMGGSANSDIALLKANLSDIKAVNDQIKPITFAQGYSVGETVFAIGNAEGEGISATKGIISVDSEEILMEVDGTQRTHRAMRIDAAIYHGNSGGGLFNRNGELVGITNGGDGDDQNINYAIPLSIVKGTADNILHYYTTGSMAAGAYKIKLGIDVLSKNTRFVYDETAGKGSVTEDLVVSGVSAFGIASSMGLKENDVLKEIIINDQSFPLTRSYNIYDALLTARAGDELKIVYTRSNEEKTSSVYTVEKSDLSMI